MSVKFENLTGRLVSIRLNSGMTLHIQPHTASSEMIDAEVNNNPKIDKLVARHVISRHRVPEKKQTPVKAAKKPEQPIEEPKTQKKGDKKSKEEGSTESKS